MYVSKGMLRFAYFYRYRVFSCICLAQVLPSSIAPQTSLSLDPTKLSIGVHRHLVSNLDAEPHHYLQGGGSA